MILMTPIMFLEVFTESGVSLLETTLGCPRASKIEVKWSKIHEKSISGRLLKLISFFHCFLMALGLQMAPQREPRDTTNGDILGA